MILNFGHRNNAIGRIAVAPTPVSAIAHDNAVRANKAKKLKLTIMFEALLPRFCRFIFITFEFWIILSFDFLCFI